jgi:hypothetical protein
MIPHLQILEVISEHFPGVEFIRKDKPGELYKDFSTITDYAISLANKAAYDELKRLLDLLAELYAHTNPIIEIAFDNILVYKLGMYLEADANRKALMDLLPETFLQIFMKQVNASAI